MGRDLLRPRLEGVGIGGNPHSSEGKVWVTCFVNGARDSGGPEDAIVAFNDDLAGGNELTGRIREAWATTTWSTTSTPTGELPAGATAETPVVLAWMQPPEGGSTYVNVAEISNFDDGDPETGDAASGDLVDADSTPDDDQAGDRQPQPGEGADDDPSATRVLVQLPEGLVSVGIDDTSTAAWRCAASRVRTAIARQHRSCRSRGPGRRSELCGLSSSDSLIATSLRFGDKAGDWSRDPCCWCCNESNGPY